MNLYKICTAKSDNHLRFRKNLLDRIKKLIVTIDDKIRDEKLQYDINREVLKTLVLSSEKMDEYEYLTDEEILLSNRNQTTEQVKFTYFLFGKPLEKQTEKQVDALKSLNLPNNIDELIKIRSMFPQNQTNDFIHNRLKNLYITR